MAVGGSKVVFAAFEGFVALAPDEEDEDDEEPLAAELLLLLGATYEETMAAEPLLSSFRSSSFLMPALRISLIFYTMNGTTTMSTTTTMT